MGRIAPGGRTSPRIDADGYSFDIGAQFLRATSPAMRRWAREWVQAGVLAEWRPVLGLYDTTSGTLRRREQLSQQELDTAAGSFFGVLSSSPDEPLFVGLPSMAALPAHLLRPQQPLQPLQGQEPGPVSALGAGEPAAAAVAAAAWPQVQSARLAEGRWWLTGPPPQQQADGMAAGGGASSGAGGGGWLGVFDALVLADSQMARPGAPGHISFQGAEAGSPQPCASLSMLLGRLGSSRPAPLLSLALSWDGTAHGPLLPGGAQAALLAGGGGAFQWLAEDSSKPGRSSSGLSRWVAITTTEFAAELLREAAAGGSGGGAVAGAAGAPGKGTGGLPPQDATYRVNLAERLWAALRTELSAGGRRELPTPVRLSAQRWGSALPSAPLGQLAVCDEAARWAACGDFCAGGGLQGAAESGAAAAEAVMAMLGLGLEGER
ncbi:hypothetical protein GPECTOR_55g262 [Gonium pectorale]|uniref:Amine oxidase domain-containing protein n=1 Tax=Gonium pectorale TaxID=33097 RepID=A0A150G640_GONPE|nr:hypothetical protein GPECTOR_55g262 [Gonium pectorale]|eukprot:KXZ45356.1 hypothetical protein GPECTOR_55g262 [Gonium pectorale]